LLCLFVRLFGVGVGVRVGNTGDSSHVDACMLSLDIVVDMMVEQMVGGLRSQKS